MTLDEMIDKERTAQQEQTATQQQSAPVSADPPAPVPQETVIRTSTDITQPAERSYTVEDWERDVAGINKGMDDAGQTYSRSLSDYIGALETERDKYLPNPNMDKERKARRVINALADGLTAISNIITTGEGARNIPLTSATAQAEGAFARQDAQRRAALDDYNRRIDNARIKGAELDYNLAGQSYDRLKRMYDTKLNASAEASRIKAETEIRNKDLDLRARKQKADEDAAKAKAKTAAEKAQAERRIAQFKGWYGEGMDIVDNNGDVVTVGEKSLNNNLLLNFPRIIESAKANIQDQIEKYGGLDRKGRPNDPENERIVKALKSQLDALELSVLHSTEMSASDKIALAKQYARYDEQTMDELRKYAKDYKSAYNTAYDIEEEESTDWNEYKVGGSENTELTEEELIEKYGKQ